MLIRTIALLMVILTLSVSATVLAAEPGSGTIDGRIVNRTAGGSSVTNQGITLKTYLNDTETGNTTSKTNAEGRFVFAGLVTDPKYSYDITVTFQEADYTSERLNFGEGETTKSTEITVYDSTTSDEAIKVATAYTIIYVEQGSLQVAEYFLFVNGADRTYIGAKEVANKGTRQTLKFPLPKEATELQLKDGLRESYIYNSEDGFIDTMPFLPGSKEIIYSYRVNHNSRAYTFSQRVNYPTASYNFLVESEATKVAGDQLTPNEPLEFKGRRFKRLSGSDFAPGDTLMAQLSGLPQASGQGAIIWVTLTLVVLGVGFGFVYLVRRRSLQPVPVSERFAPRQQRLLAELAQLDDDFEGDKIAEEVYRRLRAETKRHLVELKRGSK